MRDLGINFGIKHVVLSGNFRLDGFGRIVVDHCTSDREHLISSVTDPEHNRPKCRQLLEESLAPILGKTGVLLLNVTFIEDRLAGEAPKSSDAT